MKTCTILVTLFGVHEHWINLKGFRVFSFSEEPSCLAYQSIFLRYCVFFFFYTCMQKCPLPVSGATFLFHLRKLYLRRCISFSLDSMNSVRSTSHKIQKCTLFFSGPARKALTEAFSLITFLPLTEGPPLREQAAEPRKQFLPESTESPRK